MTSKDLDLLGPQSDDFAAPGANKKATDDQTNDVSTGQFIHIRNQQRNGKKSFTIVSGVPSVFNYEKILKYLKKTLNCNGVLVEDENFGTVIQLQGDQRKAVESFLFNEGIAERSQIKNHMN